MKRNSLKNAFDTIVSTNEPYTYTQVRLIDSKFVVFSHVVRLRLRNQIFVTCPIGCHTFSLWTFLVDMQQINNYANSQQIERAREREIWDYSKRDRLGFASHKIQKKKKTEMSFEFGSSSTFYSMSLPLHWAKFHNLLNPFSHCEPFRRLTNVRSFILFRLISFAHLLNACLWMGSSECWHPVMTEWWNRNEFFFSRFRSDSSVTMAIIQR